MVTKDDIFVITDENFTAIPRGVRHLSIYNASFPIDWMKILSQVDIEALHSITIVGDYKYIPVYLDRKDFYELVNTFLGKAINLKMVRLDTLLITTIPDFIENLKRLRYLSLSATMVTTLPKALGRLYHLQSLDIKDCDKLHILPKEMENLSNLIDFEGRHDLLPVKCFRQLQHVDKLTFNVSSGEGAKVRDLGGLRGIGWLKIEGLENISCKEEAMEAKLEDKAYLDTLECHWSPDKSLPNGKRNPEKTLEGLQPSSRLRSLKIINYGGDACPRWIGGRHLQNLRTIEFTSCTMLKEVSALGEFQESIESIKLINCVQLQGTPLLGNPNFFPPCLKILYIMNCGEFGNSLQWTHLVHLTLLEKLALEDCENIECLPTGTLQSIKVLFVSRCKKLTTKEGTEGLQGLTFLEEMCIEECPKLMDDLVKTRLALPSSLKKLGLRLNQLILASLPIEVFSSLNELRIENCPKLGPPKISNEELQLLRESNLNTFHIAKANTGSVKEWLLFLRSCKLRRLRIDAISNLQSFSDDNMDDLLAGLRSLWSLFLSNLEHIRSLPSNLHEHPSLSFQVIKNCPNIKSLSASMFPPSTALMLVDCPELLKQLPKKQFVEIGPLSFLVKHAT